MSLAPRARPLRIKSVNSKISHDMTLLPGDLIACGTSVGVGVMKEPVNTVTVAIDEIGELTNELGSSGDAFSALATPPAPVRWHRAMLTPLASHPWPLRVQFRVAARQNRRRDRLAPTRAHR